MAVDERDLDPRGFYTPPRNCGCVWPVGWRAREDQLREVEPSTLMLLDATRGRLGRAIEHSRQVDKRNRDASASWLVYYGIERILIYEREREPFGDKQQALALYVRQQALQAAATWLWPRRSGIGGRSRATRDAVDTVMTLVTTLPLQREVDDDIGFDVVAFGRGLRVYDAVEQFMYPDRKQGRKMPGRTAK